MGRYRTASDSNINGHVCYTERLPSLARKPGVANWYEAPRCYKQLTLWLNQG